MSSLQSSIVLPHLHNISDFHHLLSKASYDDFLLLAVLLLGGTAYITNGILWNKPDPYHYQWFERPQAAVADLLSAKTQTRDIAQRLEETGKQAVIFWGSQSGTAEGFAHRLAQDLHRRLQLEALVADVSDYDEESIAKLPGSKPAIFIMSTYGEGDPSDNSGHFVQWLKSEVNTKPESDAPLFSNLKFAAFGCGNSNYKYYNAVIDAVVKGLQDRGATMFMPVVGKADEAKATTEEDFLEWKTALFAQLCQQFGLTEREPEYEPAISLVFDDSIDVSGVYLGEPFAPATGRKKKSLKTPSTPTVHMPVVAARELIKTNTPAQPSRGQNQQPDRSCLHLELDFSDLPEIRYKTGDHLAVQPVNPVTEVSRLLNVLGLQEQADTPIMIQPRSDEQNTGSGDDDNTRLPSPTTLRALFQHYLEVCAPVSRETVLSLAAFAPTAAAKSFLLEIASDKAAYADFVSKHHVTLARLLQHVASDAVDPSVTWKTDNDEGNLPLSFVVESLRPMAPRYYSISSSSIISPRRAAITVANNPTTILAPTQPTSTQIVIPGVASTYLSSFVQPNHADVQKPAIYASIRRSTFKLPASAATPLILIAAGTGIAPFRAFLQERARLASIRQSQQAQNQNQDSHSPQTQMGKILLFFGCRHPDLDLLYKDELDELVHNSPLKDCLEVVYAFSRYSDGSDNDDSQKQTRTKPGHYVQDKIGHRATDVVKLLLDDDAALYICGSASMARQVGDRIGDALKTHRSMDDGALRQWREERKRVRRWQEDVW
ncbi:NADPH-cytochrome P450 reductase [Exophiala dermatitidis]